MGTRIRDVADDIPKPMIPIGGMPIIWHILRGYARHGISDFILCLGYKSWVIKRWFLDYNLSHSDFSIRLASPEKVVIHGNSEVENWQITFAETGLDTMTGCRIKRVEKYIRGNTFMLTYGDGVANVNLTELLAFHRAHGRLGTTTAVQPPGRFGELDIAGDRVAEFCEKPLAAPGWISGGFFVLNRPFFDRLDDDPELIFERQPLMNLARDGELMAYRHSGFWHPMDNSRDYKYLNDLYEAGNPPWFADPPSLASKRSRAA
jgi:glucose-1-phosphate cytidylyltransferase